MEDFLLFWKQDLTTVLAIQPGLDWSFASLVSLPQVL